MITIRQRLCEEADRVSNRNTSAVKKVTYVSRSLNSIRTHKVKHFRSPLHLFLPLKQSLNERLRILFVLWRAHVLLLESALFGKIRILRRKKRGIPLFFGGRGERRRCYTEILHPAAENVASRNLRQFRFALDCPSYNIAGTA